MIDRKSLYQWCSIPAKQLENNPDLRVPFRMVRDSEAMGALMAKEFADDIALANREGRHYRAIVPCGPKCWYEPFADYVNTHRISMKNVEITHDMIAMISVFMNILGKFRTFLSVNSLT